MQMHCEWCGRKLQDSFPPDQIEGWCDCQTWSAARIKINREIDQYEAQVFESGPAYREEDEWEIDAMFEMRKTKQLDYSTIESKLYTQESLPFDL